jgi:hypothetical protein
MCKYEAMKGKVYNARLFRLALAIILILILGAAAIIKIAYPSPLLHNFFMGVSVLEIALVLGLALCWNRWEMWALMALVFTTFGGYSLYGAIFGLPCRCLGVAVDVPRAASLIVNILLVFLCWIVLREYKLKPERTRRIIFLSCFLVVFGFIAASYLYYTKF